ncbi:MAG: hypothetical protein Fur0018_25480 [Anaerolineales bacterium]
MDTGRGARRFAMTHEHKSSDRFQHILPQMSQITPMENAQPGKSVETMQANWKWPIFGDVQVTVKSWM